MTPERNTKRQLVAETKYTPNAPSGRIADVAEAVVWYDRRFACVCCEFTFSGPTTVTPDVNVVRPATDSVDEIVDGPADRLPLTDTEDENVDCPAVSVLNDDVPVTFRLAIPCKYDTGPQNDTADVTSVKPVEM